MAELIREFATSGRFSSYVERLAELSGALKAVTSYQLSVISYQLPVTVHY